MSSTIQTSINMGQIEDAVGSLLYAYGVVNHEQDITSIHFGELNPENNLVPLTIGIKEKQQEVKTQEDNG